MLNKSELPVAILVAVLGALLAACSAGDGSPDGGAAPVACPPGQTTVSGLCEPAAGCGSVTDCSQCSRDMGTPGAANSACGWCPGRCVRAYYTPEEARAHIGGGSLTYYATHPLQNYYACGTEASAPEPARSTDYVCCGGRAEATICAGMCVNPNTDVQHCGACGHACSTGQRCCGGTCLDASDRMNCGACGHACPGGQDCVAGACVACAPGHCTTCPGTQTVCAGACVDTASDARNCGGCGVACPGNQMCLSGRCGCVNACGATCVDLSTDHDNCGRCGSACGDAQLCRGGGCAACLPPGEQCSASNPCCTGMCNTTYDSVHGTTFSVCCRAGNGERCTRDLDCCPYPTMAGGEVQYCTAGVCVHCETGSTRCPSGCANVRTDPANCGGCGNACPPGSLCINGACGTCSAPNLYCAGACVDPMSDANHCGGCFRACPSGQRCTGGRCVPTCVPSCAGRVCGPDTCGNSGACGRCPTGQSCHADGTCHATGGCTPSCAGRACGTDGCGGSCGACPSGQTCAASGTCTTSGGGTCTDFTPCMSQYPSPTVCSTYFAYNNTCGAQATCRFTRADGSGGCVFPVPGRNDCLFMASGTIHIVCVPTGNHACEVAIGCGG